MRFYIPFLLFLGIFFYAPANGTDQLTAQPQPAIFYKRILLKLYAAMGFGIKLDQATGQYVYYQQTPFHFTVQSFHKMIMQGFHDALKKQYSIDIKPETTKFELLSSLDTKLRSFGTLPLKKFIIEGEAMRKQLEQIVGQKKAWTQDDEQALAKWMLQPLSRLYDATYGTVIKQSEEDKYNMMVGVYEYDNGLKQWFDLRRKVLGMRPIEQMPKTFQYFHLRAKRYTSQYDQDGVIEAIFEAIKDKHQNKKFFVEVGGGSILDNTAYLRNVKGWEGKLFNSGTYFLQKTDYPITDEYVKPQAAVGIFQKYNISKNFDFLSIDVDSRDCWIWAAIAEQYSPAVVSVEFNSNFGANVSASVSQFTGAGWAEGGYHDKHYGCTARAAMNIANKHGYAYVYHHPFTDIFFVRKELLPSHLPPMDINETFDAIPLHYVDTKFKQYVVFDARNKSWQFSAYQWLIQVLIFLLGIGSVMVCYSNQWFRARQKDIQQMEKVELSSGRDTELR